MAKIETGIFYYKVAGRDCQRRKTVRKSKRNGSALFIYFRKSENQALEMEIVLN